MATNKKVKFCFMIDPRFGNKDAEYTKEPSGHGVVWQKTTNRGISMATVNFLPGGAIKYAPDVQLGTDNS